MPNPGLALGGGALVSGIGGLFGSSARRKEARANRRAQQQALAFQKQVFETQQENLQPFLEAGQGALPGLQALLTPEGRSEALAGFYGGPEFQTLNQQARGSALASAAAGGTLGGSTTQNELKRIAPGLGLNFLDQQFGRLGNVANIGLSAGGQQGAFAGQQGANIASLIQSIGQSRGQEASAFGNTFGNIFGQVGGFAAGRGLEGLF